MHKILTLLIIIFFSVTANGQWTTLNSSTYKDLSVIHQTPTGSLLIANSGYPTASYTGIILKSDNGGSTWYNVANHNRGFSEIIFPSPNLGLAIPKSRDTIFKSTDGGNTWQKYYSPNCFGSAYGFPQVVFTDSLTGYAPGYKTTDGGSSWILQDQSLNFFPYIPAGIAFLNDSTGVVVGFGYSGENFKTTNKGITWVSTPIPPFTWEIYSVHFPTSNIGYSTANKYHLVHETQILKTIDQGSTWTEVYTELPFTYCLSVFCTDSNTCYTVGSSGTILKTTDGGVTWGRQSSGTTHTLHKVYFTDANTGYIVGDSGTVLKTTNGGGFTGIPENAGNENVDVFPNPCQGQLTVRYQSGELLQFVIYNSLGIKITDQLLKNKTSTIDLSDYSNGIYFYELTSSKNIVKKGTVIKQ